MSKIGLYVHIPFCRQKCLYCDFPSYAGAEHLIMAYTTALCQQIADQGGLLCKPEVDTIYFGGGTPSLLPVSLQVKILDSINNSFCVSANAEISMEANPGTVTKQQLAELRSTGINRLSFGVQSFNDQLLRRLGRIHKTADSLMAIEYACAAGFNNISIDLMYGLPGQTATGFAEELEQAVLLPLSHLSVYGLKIEEGTPMADEYEKGKLDLPDEVEEEEMYDLMTKFLPGQGFERYEISNFARPGMECRHNLKYWQYKPYLGLGAAAHSFMGSERFSNIADVKEYIAAISSHRSPVSMTEKLNKTEIMAEYVFLALRTTQGLSLREFCEFFSVSFIDYYHAIIGDLTNKNLIYTNNERVWLTAKGMKFGNVVFSSFLPDN